MAAHLPRSGSQPVFGPSSRPDNYAILVFSFVEIDIQAE